MKIVEHRGSNWLLTYPSLIDLYNLDMPASSAASPDIYKYMLTAQTNDSRAYWASGMSCAEMLHTLDSLHYPRGVQLIGECMESMHSPRQGNTRRSTLVRQDEGDELDIHQVLRGDLDTAWSARRNTLRRAPRVYRILVGINGASNVSAEDIAITGALSVALSQLFQRGGDRTEIAIFSYTRSINRQREHCIEYCTVKRPQEAVNIPLLSVAVACTATMRYALMAHEAHSIPNCTHGMGSPCDPSSVAHLAPRNPRAVDIIVPPIHDISTAREFIARQTEKINNEGVTV